MSTVQPTSFNKRYVLGIDPGVTTGWSLVDIDTGEEHSWMQVKFIDMPSFLCRNGTADDIDVCHIIIEDFALLPGKAKAQIGSQFETVQVIGMFKLWAEPTHTPVHMQSPAIKPLAERFTGRKPASNHALSHHTDAYNHACFWLRKQGRFKTKLEREGH